MIWLLNDARPRAQAAIESDDFESELAELLDKLAVIGATFLDFEQDELFERLLGVFVQIYSVPLGQHDDQSFSYSTSINPDAKAPRVFLAVLERIYALGALAVRLKRWEVIRQLILQRPERIDSYWTNWLRHGLTIASRAHHLTERREDGTEEQLSLLTLSAQVVEKLPALHPDTNDDDELLTSLAQFDFLSNLVAIDDLGEPDGKAYYTNWGRFRQQRIQPVADRLLNDPVLREAVFTGDDSHLAEALQEVGRMAHNEGVRYFGFWGWEGPPVADFIAANS